MKTKAKQVVHADGTNGQGNAVVFAQNEGRVPDPVPIRPGRMLQSPFAVYRGTAAIMAADLAHTPSSGLRVQACGDATSRTSGAFATPERAVIFDINDLDETLPAPWEWDLKRLTERVRARTAKVVDGRSDRPRERWRHHPHGSPE